MKFLHLSDLHIGKRVNGFSMLDDQRHILAQILEIIQEKRPDAVIIAGDVYDKTLPPAEAVQVFDDFLTSLHRRKIKVFIISGNHDSPERIAFGSRLMEPEGIYLSPVYSREISPTVLTDEYGEINIYLLPFIKPAHVRAAFPDLEINSYTDAVKAAVSALQADTEQRNVLVTHQFVTGAVRSESEELSAGGTDNVDVSVFDGFDYVALGHIHRPQQAGKETVRYCGTPLKYSFSECSHKKSVTFVELSAKGDTKIETVPLVPLRDLYEIKGTYMEVTAKSFYENLDTGGYFHITLTDEEDVPDAPAKLRTIYPNLMKLDYDNLRTRSENTIFGTEKTEEKSPSELFDEFYRLQNNRPMTETQREFLQTLTEEIWEEKSCDR